MSKAHYRVECCMDCLFLDCTQAYEWSHYGCAASDEVDSERTTAQIESGVSPKCPLYHGSITIALEGLDDE